MTDEELANARNLQNRDASYALIARKIGRPESEIRAALRRYVTAPRGRHSEAEQWR